MTQDFRELSSGVLYDIGWSSGDCLVALTILPAGPTCPLPSLTIDRYKFQSTETSNLIAKVVEGEGDTIQGVGQFRRRSLQ